MHGGTLGALLLVVLAGLAGCIDAPDIEPEDDETTDTKQEKPRERPVIRTAAGVSVSEDTLEEEGEPLALAARRFTGGGAFEPTIGVDSEGVLFMSNFDPLPHIVRSMDQGETWEVVTNMLPTGQTVPPQSNDPYVYVDPVTGRVFADDLQALMCSWLNWSDDLGETWTTNPVGCGHPVGVHDHQTIGTATPRVNPTVGYDSVVYYCVNRVADSVCATSLNGGLTFGPLIMVFPGAESGLVDSPNSGFCGGLHGHVASAPDGTVYLPKGQCGLAMLGKSVDDGTTWTRHLVDSSVGTQGHEVRVAVDEANNVFVFWVGEDGLPYLAMSRDAAQTWSDPIMVAPEHVTATDFPAVAAGAEGRIAFVYAGTEVEGGYGSIENDTAWHAYIGVVSDAFADDPVIQTVRVTNETHPVTVGPCGTTRCPGLGDFIDIVIDPDGRPWAALADGCSGMGAEECQRSTIGPAFVGTLAEGPALRGEPGPLPPLPYEP